MQTESASATAEISRILMQDALNDGVPEADRAYHSSIVASRSGISPDNASARVDQVPQHVEDAKNTALAAADEVRKSAAIAATVDALSLLVSAFIASAAAAFGDRQRDEDEAALIATR